MTQIHKVTTPEHPALDELCQRLTALADETDRHGAWPTEQLQICGQYGVYRWFMPSACGGYDWSDRQITQGYLRLAASCLTTTFIITQRAGACRRILGADDNPSLQSTLLPALAAGASFATVGISHLTTSRRHLAKPVLEAREAPGGFILDGFSPWVTGGSHAQTVVIGATLADGRQLLLALPMDLPGVAADPPAQLVGLSGSHTGAVRCENLFVPEKWLIAGPVHDVMRQGVGAGTGGLQTSTLAVGLASAAIGFLETEAAKREDLSPPAKHLRQEQQTMENQLLLLADGVEVCSAEDFRARANSLALRASQAALAAAKGSGYVLGHPAGRWCREAMFFLVWSCPAPVLAANLCELAGFAD